MANSQTLLWQSEERSSDYAELCNALYERELNILSFCSPEKSQSIALRIKSLPHYIKKTAYALSQVNSPLTLDIQNASWSAKQAKNIPSKSQLSHYDKNVLSWYLAKQIEHGLVVPIGSEKGIVLDSIDKIDIINKKIRTNEHGWFTLIDAEVNLNTSNYLLKPTKNIMIAACAGHRWLNNKHIQPRVLSLRQLLLSTNINWGNFRKASL